MTAYTNTKDGKIEAPSWYKNADGSTPSTMQKGLTKEKWEAQNAAAKAKNEKKEAQRAAERAPREQQQQAKTERRQSAAAYAQSRKDLQAAKDSAGKSQLGQQSGLRERFGAADQWKQRHDFISQEKQDAAWKDGRFVRQQLQDTGYEYTPDEIRRHKNYGREQEHNPNLYKDFGGYDNWYQNHSMFGEGGFKGTSNIVDFDQTMKRERERTSAANNFYQNDFMKKYGQYDWAQKQFNARQSN